MLKGFDISRTAIRTAILLPALFAIGLHPAVQAQARRCTHQSNRYGQGDIGQRDYCSERRRPAGDRYARRHHEGRSVGAGQH